MNNKKKVKDHIYFLEQIQGEMFYAIDSRYKDDKFKDLKYHEYENFLILSRSEYKKLIKKCYTQDAVRAARE